MTPIAVVVAIAAALVVAVVVGAAAMQNDDGNPEVVVAQDPTALPTVTPPARVPPPPDQLRNPTLAPEQPTPSVDVLLPDASEIRLNDEGRYYADGPKGCPWTEWARARSIDRKSEEILFTNSCDQEVFLRYNPTTGKTGLFVQ